VVASSVEPAWIEGAEASARAGVTAPNRRPPARAARIPRVLPILMGCIASRQGSGKGKSGVQEQYLPSAAFVSVPDRILSFR
jgi:hypothetical protein